MEAAKYRFDSVDHRFMRIRGQLTPGERLQAMLVAREWVINAMRSRVARRYPHLSPQQVNLKVLEDLDYAERRATRSESLP